MRRLAVWACVAGLLLLPSVSWAQGEKLSGIGAVGKLVTVKDSLKSAGALASDYEGNVFFAEIGTNKIYKHVPKERKTTLFLELEGEPAGLASDPRGKLIVCMPGAQQVRGYNLDNPLSTKDPVLAEDYQGKRFGRPTGVAVDSAGGLYVSDPPAKAVYYISRKDDKVEVHQVLEDLPSPSDVLLAPNGKTLYVLLGKTPIVMAYPVDPDKPGAIPEGKEGSIFCTLQEPEEANFEGGIGFTTDAKGNLFIATAIGIQVYDPEGKFVGTIETEQVPVDCVFGGADRKTLFYSTEKAVFATNIEIPFDIYPIVLLVLGIFLVFLFILYLRFHAFLALILSALIIGFLSPRVMLQAGDDSTLLQLVQAPLLVAQAFGDLMGRIGLAIAFATIIGKALMDSGAADRIVRFFTNLFGERLAPVALLASGFILSIPVFFDNVFLLLVPLARALYVRTGKNYMLYVIAIGAGGAVTHSLVPPTPGPIVMSDVLNVDLGYTIMMGTIIGIPVSLVGFSYAAFANTRWPVEMRATGGVSLEELEERASVEESELPPLWLSLTPILLPVLFIASRTVFDTLTQGNPELNAAIDLGAFAVKPLDILSFFGNPSIALLIAALLSMVMVARQKQMSRESMKEFTVKALDDAGMILLITSAGGAFGAMLRNVGVGESLGTLADMGDVPILVLAWGLAVLFKIAQGSGTVAMITAAQIIMGILTAKLQAAYPGETITGELMGQYLGYHPVYLVMAIGVGSKIASWMNDSGFWVVSRMGGLTEPETVRSWTMCLISMGIVGLPFVWVLSQVMPLI